MKNRFHYTVHTHTKKEENKSCTFPQVKSSIPFTCLFCVSRSGSHPVREVPIPEARQKEEDQRQRNRIEAADLHERWPAPVSSPRSRRLIFRSAWLVLVLPPSLLPRPFPPPSFCLRRFSRFWADFEILLRSETKLIEGLRRKLFILCLRLSVSRLIDIFWMSGRVFCSDVDLYFFLFFPLSSSLVPSFTIFVPEFMKKRSFWRLFILTVSLPLHNYVARHLPL